MLQGQKIRCKSWPQDYYIFLHENEIIDSMSNVFAYDYKLYFDLSHYILDASKDTWDIYCDDIESHL